MNTEFLWSNETQNLINSYYLIVQKQADLSRHFKFTKLKRI
jgi:hypothetical protein